MRPRTTPTLILLSKLTNAVFASSPAIRDFNYIRGGPIRNYVDSKTKKQCSLATPLGTSSAECLDQAYGNGKASWAEMERQDDLDTTGQNQNDALPLCVGIRGNGPRLFAHFPALARIVEALGPIHGAAGGSSASMTTFILESIESNPYVLHCGEGMCCTDVEQRARVSFLLKSVQALREDIINPSLRLIPVITQVLAAKIPSRLQHGDEVQALDDLIAILLNAEDGVVNPAAIEILQTSPNPFFHAADILGATFGAASDDFTVNDDPFIFVREYLPNFLGAAEGVDIAASFYAGFAPVDSARMRNLLDACAVPSLGLEWVSGIDQLMLTVPVISDVGARSTVRRTCGEEFMVIFTDFEEQRASANFPSRLDDKVGSKIQTMITTSVLRGNGATLWKQAVSDYETVNLPINLKTIFDEDVRLGYFGDKKSLGSVRDQLPYLFDDVKSRLYLEIGEATWRDVLLRSPAEPTVSRGVEINNSNSGNLISVGGWVDPVPAQVLRSMGCDRVVLVNRPDGTGTFPLELAGELGISQEMIDDLYDLTDPSSSWTTALFAADATICADWDVPEGSDVEALAQTGYNGVFLSDNPCILSQDVGATDEIRIGGCTPLEPVYV